MRFLIFIVFFFSVLNVQSQKSVSWIDLTQGIAIEPAKSKEIIPSFRKAVFSSNMIALEGKEVVITGYFLVLDGAQSAYLLSKNPMASCFFCGNGGPETIIELQFSKKPTHKMDDLVSVKGILKLNGDDPNHCYYTIEDVKTFSIN